VRNKKESNFYHKTQNYESPNLLLFFSQQPNRWYVIRTPTFIKMLVIIITAAAAIIIKKHTSGNQCEKKTTIKQLE
jgi:hypothetical protein